ncbi:hypothetical protein WJX81_007210 [Elliptochloris bilobata]|uniref:Fibronectin type III-like domain-containing protein n=1 Tax=Elliptochloris bilobata TaxID=381761 RepID=A0AAW1S0V1_9CHLO
MARSCVLVLAAFLGCTFSSSLFGPVCAAQGSVALGRLLADAPASSDADWRDASAPVAARVRALLDQMTTDEKTSQLDATTHPTGGVDRLGVPAFQGWNECLHGVMDTDPLGERTPEDTARGTTSFPMPLGQAAAFDPALVRAVAGAIADEARAKSNIYRNSTGTVRHLNCFGPNINIFRDPRWGRGHETFGEDPYLTGTLAAAFMQGLQSNDTRYIKVGGTCKHWVAYSLETSEGFTRQSFNAVVSPRDMEVTYQPAFYACIREGGARSVMCSYNAFNGVPSCGNAPLLTGRLRGDWGFDGFIVSDCYAIKGITFPGRWTNTSAEGHAMALKAGTDMACTEYSGHLNESLAQGLVSAADIDTAAGRVLAAKFRLGVFDAPEQVPFSGISASAIGSDAHMALALEAAQKSIVLLKNKDAAGRRLLPLDAGALKKVVVMGPHARSSEVLMGNYYGTPARRITSPLEALQAALGADKVTFEQGVYLDNYGADWQMENAAKACEGADAAIIFLGLSSIKDHRIPQSDFLEVKADWGSFDMHSQHTESEGYDRRSLELPGMQETFVRLLARLTSTPLIVVLVHGGPVDVEWLQESPRVGAILTAWYPGEMGAQAITDVLLGKVSPSARLPMTFYYNNYTRQNAMANMDMAEFPGRTYRYLQVPVLYPFGHGLSYTSFAYSGLAAVLLAGAAQSYNVSVTVSNTGGVAADEVVLLYLTAQPSSPANGVSFELPRRSLRGYQRVTLAPGAAASVAFPLGPADFAAAVHAGAGAQAAAATWGIAVGGLTVPLAAPVKAGAPASAPSLGMSAATPAQAAPGELRAQSVASP